VGWSRSATQGETTHVCAPAWRSFERTVRLITSQLLESAGKGRASRAFGFQIERQPAVKKAARFTQSFRGTKLGREKDEGSRNDQKLEEPLLSLIKICKLKCTLERKNRRMVRNTRKGEGEE